MKYRVKRLQTEDRDPSGYQLFSETGSLLLVADFVAAAGAGQASQIRFIRPDGTLLATMGLTSESIKTQDAVCRDYVIIQDFAVYAIVTRREPLKQDAQEKPRPVFYTLEAEGTNWLILPAADAVEHYILYGQISLAPLALDSIIDNELPPLVGDIYRHKDEESDVQIDLSSRRWRQTSLVILALALLLDMAATVVTPADPTPQP
jgi:hypothetical protein